MNLLEVKNLSKSFGNFKALKNVSFSIQKGEIFGFLGPNGAGKSTTIRIIMGFLHPTEGNISIFGVNSVTNSVELKKQIGYIPAEPVLYQDWTVDEHIRFLANIRGSQIKPRADELRKVLDLDGKKKVKQLSTGNQQKLAIVLALCIEPALLVLDEPTRGLDPLLRATFHTILRNYQKKGGTILLSSHDLSEVEDLCDKIVIIHNGKLIQDTTVSRLRSNHGHKVKAHFVDSTPNLKDLNGIKNLITTTHTAVFNIKGTLQPMLDILAASHVEDLEITSSSLEDIFEEIYK
jgi:ABC-2 type transport system ATP-binding protein